MNKRNILWTVNDLVKNYKSIEFPEFQREPTVWDLTKKMKLIDSILRNFDIASLYLYRRPDGYFECIDGRQRINAIISFLGLNEDEDDANNLFHNKFKFKSSDELLGESILENYDNKTFEEFTTKQKASIKEFQFNVIEITDINTGGDELNLMFLRLQLGAPLNAGEKLNAMVGDMKKFIFEKVGQHTYFAKLNIPKRRFSKELTASQIAINFYALIQKKEFTRARFLDLQEFYKNNLYFNDETTKINTLLMERLTAISGYVSQATAESLKNRAIGITVFFFINKMLGDGKEKKVAQFIKFIIEFIKRLKVQIAKGIDIEPRYRDLLKFQTYISQAAVEKYAIENRQAFLEDYFEYYQNNGGKIKGDK